MEKLKLIKTLVCLTGTIHIPFYCISCNVNKEIDPTNISINVPDEIYKNDTYILTSKIEPEDANQQVVWSVDDPEIATINPTTGEFTPKKQGNVVIFATSIVNPHLMVCKNVTVKCIPEKISIIGDKDIAAGSSQKYSAIVEPIESSQVHTWKVLASPNTATITDDGLLTISSDATIGDNVVLIAESENEKIPYAQMKINIKTKPSSIVIDECPDKIGLNESYQCVSHCLPETSKQDVIWSVSDESYATINNGILIGKKVGTVVVRATSKVDESIFVEKSVLIQEMLPSVQDFTTDSWSTIAAYLFNGLTSLREAYKNTDSYKKNGSTFVGLTRPLQLDGIWYDVRVVGEEQDEIYGSNGKKVALTFEFVQPFVTKTLDSIVYIKSLMWDINEKPITNSGRPYWYNSETQTPSFTYSFLNDDIAPLIDSAMGFSSKNSIIKTVEKTTLGFYDDKDWDHWKAMKSADKVFLPSMAEIFNFDQIKALKPRDLRVVYEDYFDDYKQENQRYQWYANNSDENIRLSITDDDASCDRLAKFYPNEPITGVWLRTIKIDVQLKFFYFDNHLTYNSASNKYSFAPMFCI